MSDALTLIYNLQDELKDEIDDSNHILVQLIHDGQTSTEEFDTVYYLKELGRKDAFTSILASVNNIVNELE